MSFFGAKHGREDPSNPDPAFITEIVTGGTLSEHYHRIEMPPDNSCQFHAMNYMLKNNYPRDASHATVQAVRDEVCNELEEGINSGATPLPVTALKFAGWGRMRGDGIFEIGPSTANTRDYPTSAYKRSKGKEYETSDSANKPMSTCRKPATWGNQQTLVAAANLYGVRIAVVTGNAVHFIDPASGAPKATWVFEHGKGSAAGGDHYDIFAPIEAVDED